MARINPRSEKRRSNPIADWFERIPVGRFEGNPPLCEWIGPDSWLFVPSSSPFTFVRGNGERIVPGVFNHKGQRFPTNGGSIPVLLRGLPKLSMWHYGAAYIIHDWLFWLKREGASEHGFEEANLILIEAIKTLMIRGYLHGEFEVDPGLARNIWRGVNSHFGKQEWNKK